MITIEEIYSGDIPEFEQLFQASLPAMDSGSYAWPFLGSPSTYEEKLSAFREHVNRILSAPNGRGLLWRIDGHPINFLAGFFNSQDPKYITWSVGLHGPDENGSRAWLYSHEYISGIKSFLRDEWGLEGHRMFCLEGTSMHRCHLSKAENTDYYDVSVSEPIVEKKFPEVSTVIISYRYL